MCAFAGNTADPTTVAARIEILTKQFAGDRGMVKSAGKKALDRARFRYISTLTDPQIRRLTCRTGLASNVNLVLNDDIEARAIADHLLWCASNRRISETPELA